MKQNKIPEDVECVSLGSGCPNMCEYCKEPSESIFNGIPTFSKNKIKLNDMNILAYPEAREILSELGRTEKYFELVCGIDFRRLTPEIAKTLRTYRFGRFNSKGKWQRYIRFAWDYRLDMQYKMKDTYSILINVGFKPNQIGIFVLVNWRISYEECCLKLDTLKIWGCHVIDCCYDGGYNIDNWDIYTRNQQPKNWSYPSLKRFRMKCRKHNQLINFNGIDPELK